MAKSVSKKQLFGWFLVVNKLSHEFKLNIKLTDDIGNATLFFTKEMAQSAMDMMSFYCLPLPTLIEIHEIKYGGTKFIVHIPKSQIYSDAKLD